MAMQDCLRLTLVGLRLAGRLLRVMLAETGERHPHAIKLGMTVKARPQLEVGGDSHTRIEPPARTFPKRAAPEGGFLHNPRARWPGHVCHVFTAEEGRAVEAFIVPARYRAPSLVQKQGIA